MTSIARHIIYMTEHVLADDLREISEVDKWDVLLTLKRDIEATIARMPPCNQIVTAPSGLPIGHRQPPG